MNFRVIPTPEAEEDIIDFTCYFLQHSVPTAQRFLDCVDQTYKILSRMPTLGSLRFFRSPEMQDVRTWAVKNFRNYILFYRIDEKRVIILRVLHAAMNYEEMFNREDEIE